MDKREIYEHLAKIYLDASSKKQKKTKAYPKFLKNRLFIGVFLVFCLGSAIFFVYLRSKPFNSQVALVLTPDALKINFNFDPAKKEIYSLDLNKLNLSKYKALGFSVKKADYKDTISLRVEFTNSFREKSEIYVKDIPHKWQDYKVNFSDFRNINNWQEMINLSFAIEEWNTKQNNGVVYIDNVRLLK